MALPKPNMKIGSLAQNAMQGGVDYLAGGLRWAFSLSEDWYQKRDLVKNNYELGLLHFAKGNFSDASFRFKLVTWFAPKDARGWYQLGRAYLAEGKRAAAITALKKSAALAPANEETHYMLAVAGGSKAEKLPKKMPLSLCLEHFEGLAESYDDEQLNTYGYKGHVLLADAVRAALPAGRVDNIVVELGVGTGLCGSLLRPVVGKLVGVDFSPKMLAEAAKLKTPQGQAVYDELILQEAQQFLGVSGVRNQVSEKTTSSDTRHLTPDSCDAIIAAGLLSYIGDVQELVSQSARALKTGGVFGFTAEMGDGEGYRFLPDAGRFGFSEKYLQQLAAAAGLCVVKLEKADTYPDFKAWLGVFRK
ncbi:MAG: methyltransferase [Alphaproteobacteria bacterium]|nr:methyltransferase [Alphaproteobacteria bacterium]